MFDLPAPPHGPFICSVLLFIIAAKAPNMWSVLYVDYNLTTIWAYYY
jgi:hypothetical protein